MKKITLIFSLLSFCILQAQTHNVLLRMTKAKDSVICFNCGFGESKAVMQISKLIKDKEFSDVKKLLWSENAAVKFLAAITCNKLDSTKKLILSDAEKRRINEIYNSKDTLYAISNDTYINAKPIKDYFIDPNDKLIMSQTKIWLKELLE